MPNEHKFAPEIVDAAAALMHRWFNDDTLGWCRVVKFGALTKRGGKKEPLMYYTYLRGGSVPTTESSSLHEVSKWVAAEGSNV